MYKLYSILFICLVELILSYFLHMKALLVGGLVLGDIELKKLTAKTLYEGFTSSFPAPKIVFKFDIDWSLVWCRLQCPMLESGAREVLFMGINNIIANGDRLHSKFHMVPSPNCVHCNVLHDNVHLFCECLLVREAWFWVRQRILWILPKSEYELKFTTHKHSKMPDLGYYCWSPELV